MQNVITVDVEDWFHTNDWKANQNHREHFESRVERNTERVLELLEKHQVKATFFILSDVAEKCPKIVKDIASQGHEIGSHGTFHKMVHEMNATEFKKDVQVSCAILSRITGKKVLMYRAPTWSISYQNLWALEILESLGMVCDSSFQPFRTHLSGEKHSPVNPFHPVVNGKTLKLIEFPSSICKWGPIRLPFAGGFYLRLMPRSLIHLGMQHVNKTRPAMVYFHPWEIDPFHPRVKGTRIDVRFGHYYNMKSTVGNIESLLKKFEFVPLGEYIKDKTFPKYPIAETDKKTR